MRLLHRIRLSIGLGTQWHSTNTVLHSSRKGPLHSKHTPTWMAMHQLQSAQHFRRRAMRPSAPANTQNVLQSTCHSQPQHQRNALNPHLPCGSCSLQHSMGHATVCSTLPHRPDTPNQTQQSHSKLPGSPSQSNSTSHHPQALPSASGSPKHPCLSSRSFQTSSPQSCCHPMRQSIPVTNRWCAGCFLVHHQSLNPNRRAIYTAEWRVRGCCSQSSQR